MNDFYFHILQSGKFLNLAHYFPYDVKLRLLALIIHQIFSLARDWSKRVTWANIPQLKLGNILGYSPIFKTTRVAKKI